MDEFLEWQANFKPEEITEEMTEAVIKEIKKQEEQPKPFDIVGSIDNMIFNSIKNL